MENSMVTGPKIKNRNPIQWNNSTLGYVPWKTESSDSKKGCSTQVHRSIIHSNQKVGTIQCLSADKWINKMWQIHTVDYYSALNTKGILTEAFTSYNVHESQRHYTKWKVSYYIGQVLYDSIQMRYRCHPLFKIPHYATLLSCKTCVSMYSC